MVLPLVEFDWTISVGNLLSIIGMVTAISWFVVALRGRLDIVEHDLSSMKASLATIATYTVQTARLEGELGQLYDRFNALSNRVDDLIFDRGRHYDVKSKTTV